LMNKHNGVENHRGFIRCIFLVYARHGRELMGCKSPVLESKHCRETGYIKY
jgi:hypothetical protein